MDSDLLAKTVEIATNVHLYMTITMLTAGVACTAAIYACHRAINSEILVKALENSTHKIQYMPVEVPGLTDDGPTDAQEAAIDQALTKQDREAMARLNMEVEPLD